MDQTLLKKRLGWLEAALYIGGALLLVVFFNLKASADNQREEGIRAFEAASEIRFEDPASGQAGSVMVTAPDTGLWAEKRIAEYEESIKVEAEAPLAVLNIDKLGIQVPVFNGTDDFNLNRGVGRIKGTARVDAEGNLGIAGHRDGFFRGLKDIAVGDRIELQTVSGPVGYSVSSIVIVDPTDVSVLAPTDEKSITLVTCYPFYYVGHAPKRFIVKANIEHSPAET